MKSQKKTYITKNGKKIIYNYLEGGERFLIFLGGFMSDREGTKALFFEKYCEENRYSYIRFDYLGHGESDQEFTSCTINTWLGNVLEIINNLTEGKVTLIGSSLGGWLMSLAAKKVPEKIYALIGIASAPDFTEDLIWGSLSKSEQEQLEKNNIYHAPACDDEMDPYPITMDLIKSGRENFILNNTSDLDIGNIPIRLFHGMNDIDVPYECSIKLAKKFTSSDIEITLIKNGDHRLSDNKTLSLISDSLNKIF